MNLRALLRWLRLLAVVVACLPRAVFAAQHEQELAQAAITRLEHVSVDYPYVVRGGEVADAAEYQGLQANAGEVLLLLAQLPPRPEQAALARQAAQLQAAVDARADGLQTATLARTLAGELMRLYRLTPAPRQTPNLRRAQALYQLECAACHGRGGRGDGPAAPALRPPPGDFLQGARMEGRSILELYDAITTGAGGQPGHGAHLPFGDRWDLAFFVSGLRDPPATVRRGEALWRAGQGQAQLPDLRTLVLHSPAELEQEGGPALDAVRAFLTAHPEALETSRPAGLVRARTHLREALSAYVRGDTAQARRQAAAAREDLDPIDARLEAADAALRHEIQRELRVLASAIDAHQRAGTVAAHATRIETLLDRAAELLEHDARTAAALYASALLVLLREGVEAILVLAAMAAAVRQAGHAAALRYLHAGWMAAVLLGLATWFAAGQVAALTGARWEFTEGLSTLLAAAMLLYVGFWLHRRSCLQAWAAFLRERASGALERRTLWAMAGVAFLALYRELFEIVLMVQVLWTHAGPAGRSAVAAGVASAAVLLAALAWSIVHSSRRLPLARLQAVTSVLLVAIALVFVGHGISELQDARLLPATDVRFVALPTLGVHPTAQGLAAQALVAALVVAGLLRNRRQLRRGQAARSACVRGAIRDAPGSRPTSASGP